MCCKLASAVMVTVALLAATAAKANDWLTYQNDRYGTTIDYPAIFKMQRPPDSDDGRAFKSADGADFTVSASYFALDSTVAKYHAFIVKNLDADSAVAYEQHGKNWFVISGTRADKIFYEKHLLSHGLNEDFVMSYPASAKSTYDPIVVRMAKSFRSGKGFQSP
ncbi:MAG TPA: hypothetical protein VHX43_18805 [Xanthobacteraceae bacterium]|jgi:hypothetical protein|nr:hypothetical protein [Xanthobacteraceae bacterium]